MSRTRIDLTSHLDAAASQTVLQVTEAIKNAWAVEAKSRLNTTARSYVDSIRSRVNLGGGSPSGEVYLEGSWANKLEVGFKPYDMKPYFQRSDKKKISEQSGQWYLHIGIRHTTPMAKGRQGTKMPNSVYREARKLPQWGKLTSSAGGSPSWGKYEGMQKVPESSTSKRSAYMTYRTVSENSPADAFIHPGFPGVHIARDLEPQIEDTFLKLMKSNMANALDKNMR